MREMVPAVWIALGSLGNSFSFHSCLNITAYIVVLMFVTEEMQSRWLNVFVEMCIA